MVTYKDIQKLALSLPETTEKLAWGSPAFYVKDKMFAAVRQDGKTLAISFPREERAIYVVTDPKTFPDLEHFKNYDYMAIAMNHIKPSELEELLRMAWTFRAPSRLAASHQELHG
ncbi:MAG TPA: MmcQ/YjbR family DNA-binding protein [Candidatus Saccharimonadales bacterium]|jgi:hypothetical protein|nr:MmcQ/YjbR family DNA-binding protein [Candidatus Saccharimonadales bacterium]